MGNALIQLICENCEKFIFLDKKAYISELKNRNEDYNVFCNDQCYSAFLEKFTNFRFIKCDFCGKGFKRSKQLFEKSKHNFCSQSCSGSYNNTERAKAGFTLKNKFKTVKCVDCSVEFEIPINGRSNGNHCSNCRPVKVKSSVEKNRFVKAKKTREKDITM